MCIIKKYSKLSKLNAELEGKNEFKLLYNLDKEFMEQQLLKEQIQVLKFKIQDSLFELLEKNANDSYRELKRNIEYIEKEEGE